jgi:hypothetical protein
VASLRELLAVGRELHAEERRLGNVSVLDQLLAAAPNDPKLAAATGAGAATVDRRDRVGPATAAGGCAVLRGGHIPGLARAVSAAFVGLELYEGVAEADAHRAMAALDQFAVLVEVVDELGLVSRRALPKKICRAATRRTRSART